MKASKGSLYQDHANGKPPVPRPVPGTSLDEFCNAFERCAVAAASGEPAILSTAKSFDIGNVGSEAMIGGSRMPPRQNWASRI